MRLLRNFWLGVALTVAALVGGFGWVALRGALFGVWGGTDLAGALLALCAGVLLMLGGVNRDRNPYYRIVPSTHQVGLDPQILYGGTRVELPPAEAQRDSNSWMLRQALVPLATILALAATRLL